MTLFIPTAIGLLLLLLANALLSTCSAAPLDNLIRSPQPQHAGSCSFENGTCHYHHDATGDFKWQLGTGPTASYFTGPENDHTIGSAAAAPDSRPGSYMYVESSNPRLNGDRARLVSGMLKPAGSAMTTCLKFFYSMYGHTMGSLRVYVKHLELDEPELLWQLHGNQGVGWKEAKVQLQVLHPFKLIFEAETSFSYLGDAAIDDLALMDDPQCFLWPRTASPVTPLTPPLVPSLPAVEICGRRPVSSRILGGSASSRGSWPWHAMIVNVKNRSKTTTECSATLVLPDWVVTAAHCVANFIEKREHVVRLGAHMRNTVEGSEQDIGIKHIYIHPKFNTMTKYNNDVAMIQLARPAIMNDVIGPVCLPGNRPQVSPGARCWITGWGELWDSGPHPGVLMQAQLPIVSNKECGHMESYPGRITSHMLCAGLEFGGIDTCDGDSGGPLVCEEQGKWFLRGITSWGDGCGQPKKYGVYARVASVQSWMNGVVVFPNKHRKAN